MKWMACVAMVCVVMVVGCKAPDQGPEPVGKTGCTPAPFTKGTVVYRLLPCQIEKDHLKDGVVVTEGLPEGIDHGVAAAAYQNRWYAKRIFYVPGAQLFKCGTKTRLSFRVKVEGTDRYLMQFLSVAKDDNIKKSMRVKKQGEWEEVDFPLMADMGFDVGDGAAELAWHLGRPGDDSVKLTVCQVVVYEPKE